MDLIEKLHTCDETRQEWADAPWELTSVDLGIHWEAIHYTLCGSRKVGEAPLSWAIKGGKELQTEDFGYGPMRVLTHAETQQVSTALEGVDVDSLVAKWDCQALIDHEVYPDFLWKRALGDDPKEYLAADFQQIKGHFHTCATYDGLASRGNLGTLLWIMSS
jgi:hypothetical protein